MKSDIPIEHPLVTIDAMDFFPFSIYQILLTA